MPRKESLLYEQVATAIVQKIKQGVLKPGDKIPSIRELVEELNVSKSTVLKAYYELEAQGVI
jgi:DNA-binding GntR family transcriptional regulator